MAAFISFQHNDKTPLKFDEDASAGEEVEWRVGEEVGRARALTWNDYMQDPSIGVCVQADCDELEKILRNVEGIPRTKARVQKWYGDDARFIIANIITLR